MADNSVACELFDHRLKASAMNGSPSDDGESIDRDIDERYLGEASVIHREKVLGGGLKSQYLKTRMSSDGGFSYDEINMSKSLEMQRQ